MTQVNPASSATEFLRDQHNEIQRLCSAISSSAGDPRREAFECLVRLLAVHETAEEEVVYPALRNAAPDGRAVADARLSEESHAKDALSELERIGTDGPRFDEKFRTFREAVLMHAESEEQLVFPRLERTNDIDELERMGKALQAVEKMAPTHPHPHGPDSAVGNMVVGPFVAVADRVRDAIRSATR